MAKHPNSKVIVRKGKVISLELWVNRKDGSTFQKIWIHRERPNRFIVTANFIGHGKSGLNIAKSIESTVEDFPQDFASLAIELFNMSNPSVRELTNLISSDYNLNMKG